MLFTFNIHGRNGMKKLFCFFVLKRYALRIITQQYVYPFLSCYTLALFKILDSCLPEILDAHNNKNMRMSWTNSILHIKVFILSILPLSQKFFHRYLSQERFPHVFAYVALQWSQFHIIFFKSLPLLCFIFYIHIALK